MKKRAQFSATISEAQAFTTFEQAAVVSCKASVFARVYTHNDHEHYVQVPRGSTASWFSGWATELEVGDRARVVGQDIVGTVETVYPETVILRDDALIGHEDGETIEVRKSELELALDNEWN